MIGVKMTGQDLMQTLKKGEKLTFKVQESSWLYNNSAILLDGTLYVSKAAVILMNDPQVSKEAFKHLEISM